MQLLMQKAREMGLPLPRLEKDETTA